MKYNYETGWTFKRLGEKELTRIKYGKANPKKDGKIPIIGSSGIYDYTNDALVEPPVIIIGRKGNAGSIQYFSEPCWPSDTTFYLKLISKELDYKFLSEYLNYRSPSSEKTQTTLPSLSIDDLSYLRVPVPPLVEQRGGIVEVLGYVDECIRLTDEVIRAAEELKRGLMQRLLTQGIGHTDYKQTPLGKTPKTWKIERLGKQLQLCEYGLNDSLSSEGKYPVFRMNNLENGYVVDNDLKFINMNKSKFENCKLEKGDLLFNRTNSYDLVGKVGIYLLEGEHTFASYLIRLRTNHTLEPKYLNYFMNLEQSQNNLRRLATRGVSQSNINTRSLKSLIIPIPPLDEQKRIIEIIENQDIRISIEQEKKKHLNLIKQGLMQLLLSGKVRVELREDGLHRVADSRETHN